MCNESKERKESLSFNSSRITHYASLSSGFTLLELMIVLFLMALIMGLSALFIAGRMPGNRLNTSARDLSATIRHAGYLARLSGERQTVTIDLSAKQYGIEGRAVRTIPPGIDIKVTDPFNGEIRSGKFQMAFQAMSGTKAGTIVLSDKKRKVSITLDPVVGSVVIKRP